jgi:hypothetical protein
MCYAMFEGVKEVKNVSNVIYERYPNIKKKIENPEFELRDKTEITLYNLSLFFENPSTNNFNLNELVNYLEGEDLVFTLKVIVDYFESSTGLLKNNEHHLLKEMFNDIEILNQKNIVLYLEKLGYNLGKNAKVVLNVYYNRGKLPNPDLIIFDKPVWFKSTIDSFLKKGEFNQFKNRE